MWSDLQLFQNNDQLQTAVNTTINSHLQANAGGFPLVERYKVVQI
jgi:hypothetical protein